MDIRKSMPLCWHQNKKDAWSAELLDEPAEVDTVRLPLTPAMHDLLRTQKKKLKADWSSVLAIFPETCFETYVYCWLIVNTRSFYFEMPKVERQPPREDRMVLCPFVDLFNHSDVGVSRLTSFVIEAADG